MSAIRVAPGRRIILLKSESKAEALAVLKLMQEQVEKNCSDEGDLIQSFYLDENGVGWFG